MNVVNYLQLFEEFLRLKRWRTDFKLVQIQATLNVFIYEFIIDVWISPVTGCDLFRYLTCSVQQKQKQAHRGQKLDCVTLMESVSSFCLFSFIA